MKLLIALFALALFAQTTGSTLFDFSTGTRCTASFLPVTAATEVQIDCYAASKPVLTGARINLANITGVSGGVAIGYTLNSERVTMLFQRTSASAALHIELGYNDVVQLVRDIAVP